MEYYLCRNTSAVSGGHLITHSVSQSDYHVALSPSPSDQAAAITSFASELGFSRIVSVTCGGREDESLALALQKRAREAHMTHQAASIKLGWTSFEAAFNNITNLFSWLKHLPSSLVTLDCSSEEVCQLENAARQLELSGAAKSQFWLITKQSALSDDVPCPLSSTGFRSGSPVELMVHDALLLLHRTILGHEGGHGLHTAGHSQWTSNSNGRKVGASQAFIR